MRGGPRWFPQNSSCSAVLRCRLDNGSTFRVRGFHPLRPRFPARSATPRHRHRRRSYNPGRRQRRPRFGLLRVRSPLLAQSFLLSLPAGTKMFQFPAFAPRHGRGVGIAPDGFPHSDIRGSQGICPSPRLFAACHVLLRLREPQASPVRPCSLSLFPSSTPSTQGTGRLSILKTFARLNDSQFNRFVNSSFCVPTMSMISFGEEIAELNRYPSQRLSSP